MKSPADSIAGRSVSFPLSGPLFGFYVRIAIMQFVLILGGVIVFFMGSALSQQEGAPVPEDAGDRCGIDRNQHQ